jgi:hypothetical protein
VLGLVSKQRDQPKEGRFWPGGVISACGETVVDGGDGLGVCGGGKLLLLVETDFFVEVTVKILFCRRNCKFVTSPFFTFFLKPKL